MQCGVVLPEMLQNKVDYTFSAAMGEAERGQMYKIQHLAPNMDRSDRQQALDNLGDTEGTRLGREAAAKVEGKKVDKEKKTSTPTTYGPKPTSASPSQAGPSSSSASTPAAPEPKIEPKAMPKGSGREGPPRKDDDVSSKRKKTG